MKSRFLPTSTTVSTATSGDLPETRKAAPLLHSTTKSIYHGHKSSCVPVHWLISDDDAIRQPDDPISYLRRPWVMGDHDHRQLALASGLPQQLEYLRPGP